MPTDGASFYPAIDISALGGHWLVLGQGSDSSWLWASYNGLDWSRGDVAAWASNRVDHLVTWQGGFVAAGSSGSGPSTHLAIWRSTDGLAWDRVADQPSFAFYQGKRIRSSWGGIGNPIGGAVDLLTIEPMSGNAQQLTVTGEPVLDVTSEGKSPTAVDEWSSVDGTTWVWHAVDINPKPVAVVSNGAIRARLSGDSIETSVDGVAWQQAWQAPPGVHVSLSAIAASRARLVAVGWLNGVEESGSDRTPVVVISADGVGWTQLSGSPDLGAGYLTAVAISSDRIVALGYRPVDSVAVPFRPYVWVSPSPTR